MGVMLGEPSGAADCVRSLQYRQKYYELPLIATTKAGLDVTGLPYLFLA